MTERNAIRQALMDLLHDETGEDFSGVSDAKNLRTELGLDSVDVVSVIAQVERRYRVRLSRQELEKLATISDLLDLLQAKIVDPGTSADASAA